MLFIKRIVVIILFISMLALISSCGKSAKNEKKIEDKTTIEKTSGCGDFVNKKGHKLRTAIILDFVNVSGDKEFEYLSTQIPDVLFRDLNRCFQILDNNHVRNYVLEKGIDKEKLKHRETAKEIAIHFGADLVIFGTYIATATEIQIIGEITHTDKSGIYNDFQITGKKDEILSKITFLSNKVSNIAATTFPPQKIDEKLIIKESTNTITVIKVVEKYIKGNEISNKSAPKPDSETLEQVPDPRPKWTWSLPMPDKYIYFIGQAMDQSEYNDALNIAIQDAYLQMSRAVGKKIESTYSKKSYRGPQGSYDEITSKLIIKTLNFVSGDQMKEKYYRKLKSGKYEVCVLFRLSFKDLKRNIEDSIKAELERLKAATAKAETEKLKSQIKLLTMLQLQKQKLAKIEQEKPRYKYKETINPKIVNKNKDKNKPKTETKKPKPDKILVITAYGKKYTAKAGERLAFYESGKISSFSLKEDTKVEVDGLSYKAKAGGQLFFNESGKISSFSLKEDTIVEIDGLSYKAKAGNYLSFYESGKISSFSLKEDTIVKAYGKKYTAKARKYCNRLSFYESGKINDFYLEENTIINAYGKKYKITNGWLSFYESGKIKQLPLKDDTIVKAYGKKYKITNDWLSFYESGNIKGFNLKDETIVKAYGKKYRAKAGMYSPLFFYESGKISSFSLKEDTIVKAYGKKYTAKADSSLFFYESGKISSFSLKEDTIVKAYGKKYKITRSWLYFYENGNIKGFTLKDETIVKAYGKKYKAKANGNLFFYESGKIKGFNLLDILDD